MGLKLYDWECAVCGLTFEATGRASQDYRICIKCGSQAKKLPVRMRPQIRFPEGQWDIGVNEVEIRSKRQLREVMKRHNDNPDHTKHSIATYDDGYGGY